MALGIRSDWADGGTRKKMTLTAECQLTNENDWFYLKGNKCKKRRIDQMYFQDILMCVIGLHWRTSENPNGC